MKINLKILSMVILAGIILLALTSSLWQPTIEEKTVRPYTRKYKFDYVTWTADALYEKLSMLGLGFNHYLTARQDRTIISDYFLRLNEKKQLEDTIEIIFADPQIEYPESETAALRNELADKKSELTKQASLAETVIQKQISITLDDMGLTELGQPFPPVFYHVTDLPKELVISPRDEIEQAAMISLEADINLEEIIHMEESIEEDTDFSALVVSVGGIGTYPTMVISTTSLTYLLETVAHEWTHNYLAFRPLGLHYSSSPELRTMNETTASITGEEIRNAVLYKYYQDLIPTVETPVPLYEASFTQSPKSQEEEFDYNQTMYQTRIKVDTLLEQGKIDEAEAYMEEQRQLFWENGYQIRKLNQAYFAFHGAYADDPYSAAGEDPVGEAVRTLRARSTSLADFIRKMSKLSSYEALDELLNTY